MQQLRNRLLIVLALLIWALVALHYVALRLFLYWKLPWFDVVTHFLGGVFIGLGALWFVYHAGYRRAPAFAHRTAFMTALFATILIGGLWEVYEYVIRAAFAVPLEANYVFDTSVDMVMDALGGLAGYALYSGLTRSTEKHQAEGYLASNTTNPA